MNALFMNSISGALPVLSAAAAAKDGGLGLFLAGIGILAFLLAALVLLIGLRRRHRLNLLYALLAVVFSAAAMVLCVVASSVGTLVAQPSGDPQQAVSGFFDALCAGRYEEAYGYLSGVTDLGLGGQPAEEVGQAMYSALQESYSYELSGSCEQDQLSARQEVLFTYLDLGSIAPDVEEETMAELNAIVEARPRAQVYDENNNYLPQVAQEAYAAAVDRVLTRAEDYTVTAGLQLDLQYVGGRWLLIPSQALLSAVSGGAA